jgi:hypothetical protein
MLFPGFTVAGQALQAARARVLFHGQGAFPVQWINFPGDNQAIRLAFVLHTRQFASWTVTRLCGWSVARGRSARSSADRVSKLG